MAFVDRRRPENINISQILRINQFFTENAHICYEIQVTLGPYYWTCKRRYSEFSTLHQQLVTEFKVDSDLIPPKHVFGVKNEAFLKKRQVDLEVYLLRLWHHLRSFPSIFADFLDMHLYEIHFITEELSKKVYLTGESLLRSHEEFVFTPLHIHAINKRLQLPEPTYESVDKTRDFGHLLDFIYRLKVVRVLGSDNLVGTSNIVENQLSVDLMIFKSAEELVVTEASSYLSHLDLCHQQPWRREIVDHLLEILKTALEVQFLEYVRLSVHGGSLGSQLSDWFFEKEDHVVDAHGISSAERTLLDQLRPAQLTGFENLRATVRKLKVHRTLQVLSVFFLRDADGWHVEGQFPDCLYWDKLVSADLSRNRIEKLDQSVRLLKNVECLDLSSNQLRSLDYLNHLHNLRKLILSRNYLSVLDHLHAKLGNVQKIVLSGNQLQSLKGLAKLYSLEHLDISDNEISSLDEVENLRNLPCLTQLNLSSNPITLVVDYRIRILTCFGARASEMILDAIPASTQEVSHANIRLALRKNQVSSSRLRRIASESLPENSTPSNAAASAPS